MKSSLNQTLRILTILSILTFVGGRSVRAHDLPADRLFAAGATADCFAMSSRRATEQPIEIASKPNRQQQVRRLVPMPLASAPLAFTRAYQSLLSSIANPTATLPALLSRIDLSSDRDISRAIVVLAPEVGEPPRPNRVAKATKDSRANRISLAEGYMPYDFNLSDWRFGQFSYRCERAAPAWSPIVASERVTPPQVYRTAGPNAAPVEPARVAAAVGQFLSQLESFQCMVSQELYNHRRQAPAMTRPLHQAPQFVVFESDNELRTVLTVEQAKEWSFQANLDNPIQAGSAQVDFDQVDLAQVESRPVKEQVLNATSRQLKNLGHYLISLSDTIASYSATNVASHSKSDMR